MANSKYIYVDGNMIPYEDAVVHVNTVAVKYGSNVFEGLCVYEGQGDNFLFRAHEHYVRLEDSRRLMQVDCDYTIDDYSEAVLSCLHANDVTGDAHIRLTIMITGDGYSETTGPASLVCIVGPRKPTRLEDRTKHAAVSSWLRQDDRIAPPRIKAGANYHNSRFGLLEARRNGYDQAIFLTLDGKISEGANSCLCMVRNGVLVTPTITSSILESVTRSTLLQLAAEELGIPCQERDIDRSEIYSASEAFFCGSGLEISPILSVDRTPLGTGEIGPVSRQLWEAYEAVLRGRNQKYAGWLTPIQAARTGARG